MISGPLLLAFWSCFTSNYDRRIRSPKGPCSRRREIRSLCGSISGMLWRTAHARLKWWRSSEWRGSSDCHSGARGWRFLSQEPACCTTSLP
ncbi:hypothetical protein CHARACLAT_030527 [Characodon lateralis]|uniref:Secreted protein n=1 Tax=Characodon lateralis TaxID=208331 RepID=A0ABU7DVK7_9TELE|nr:hypothetical protein [Characodon lateralis]